MGDGIGAFSQRNLDLSSSQQRPRERSAEQVCTFVARAGLDQRPDKLADEFVSQVLDIDFRGSDSKRLFLDAFQVIILADIADESDDLTSVVFPEPGNDDRGVEIARISQDDFLDRLLHCDAPLMRRGWPFQPAADWPPVEKQEIDPNR